MVSDKLAGKMKSWKSAAFKPKLRATLVTFVSVLLPALSVFLKQMLSQSKKSGLKLEKGKHTAGSRRSWPLGCKNPSGSLRCAENIHAVSFSLFPRDCLGFALMGLPVATRHMWYSAKVLRCPGK